MTTPPPPHIDPVPGQPAPLQPPAAEEKKLLAPIWHTALLVLVLVANSAATAWLSSKITSRQNFTITDKARIAQYLFTMAFEVFLLFLVWIGLRLKRTRIRDLIGGRWNTPEVFLLDVCIALGFWFVALGVLAGVSFLVGLTRGAQVEESKRLAELVAPHSLTALAIFVVLSTIAGFVEEIIFRGYLQRQFATLTGNIYAAIVLQAAVFGAGHGYEGTRRMVVIFVYGIMFGFLALWRRSLRPGMMAHAVHDSAAGIALFFVARHGFPSVP